MREDTDAAAVVEGLIAAENAADRAAAERLLAPDFRGITRARGVEQDRAGLLHELANPPRRMVRRLEAPADVLAAGDLAIARSVIVVHEGTSPLPMGRFRNTHVLRRSGGSWTCVAWQVTMLT